jgi:hypothetical protein
VRFIQLKTTKQELMKFNSMATKIQRELRSSFEIISVSLSCKIPFKDHYKYLELIIKRKVDYNLEEHQGI